MRTFFPCITQRSNCIASIAAAFISAFTKRNAEPMLVIPSVLYCLELVSLVAFQSKAASGSYY